MQCTSGLTMHIGLLWTLFDLVADLWVYRFLVHDLLFMLLSIDKLPVPEGG
jgi:hypothetical protein